MSRLRVKAAWVGLLAGCGGAPSPDPVGSSEPTVVPEPQTVSEAGAPAAQETPVPQPVVPKERKQPVAPADRFDLVEIWTEDGPFAEQLETQRRLAEQAGRVAYVEFYGDWCSPCKALRAAMTDPLMQDAFAGTRIVLVDTEQWRAVMADPNLGADMMSVPSFYRIKERGILGASIDGHAWEDNVPAEMAPVLAAFFDRAGRGSETR